MKNLRLKLLLVILVICKVAMGRVYRTFNVWLCSDY
jgi:hypothetical protein